MVLISIQVYIFFCEKLELSVTVNYKKQAQKYSGCFKTCIDVSGRLTFALHAYLKVEDIAKWEWRCQSTHSQLLNKQQR